MNKTQLREMVTFEGVEPLKIQGEEFSKDFIKSTLLARIWRSATVVKNKRESDKGGIKTTILQAISEGLIEKEEGFDLVMTPNKEKIAELKEKLPSVEKSEEPTEEDIKIAITQVLANKGQAS